MEQELPVFSIIVPTYARPGQLTSCLRSLARLDYPRDRFEVIVVDDGNKAPLEGVVVPFHERMNITLISQRHAGAATARNTGASRAKGEFFAFTDDDCTPAQDWLQALAARFALTPDQAIGGRTLNALPDNPYSTASQAIIDVVYAYYNAEPNRACFFASNNLALPADGFRAIAGFDATFTASEDRDFCARWLYDGHRMTYAPEVQVHHAHPLTLPTFCRQHFTYGRGDCRFHQACVRRGTGRPRLDVTFYLALLRYPFSQVPGRRASLMAALLAVSQLAKTTGFLWELASQTARRDPQKISEDSG